MYSAGSVQPLRRAGMSGPVRALLALLLWGGAGPLQQAAAQEDVGFTLPGLEVQCARLSQHGFAAHSYTKHEDFLRAPLHNEVSPKHADGNPIEEGAGGRVDSSIAKLACYLNGFAFVTMLFIVLRVMMTKSETHWSEERSEDRSISQVLPSVLVWGLLGIALICFNKSMYLSMEEGGYGFPCPIALTWCHMVAGVVMTNIIKVCRPALMPAVHAGGLDGKAFLTAVVPIAVVFSSYLAIGNIAYLYLSVSFVQMLKSAGPLAVHAIAAAAGLERITAASVTAVSIVAFGVMSASVGELAFSWVGFALQLTAFLLDGVRLVLFKVLMSSRGAKLDPLSGMYYYCPLCAACLILPLVYFEGEAVMSALITPHPLLFAAIVSNSLVAFSLNLALLSLFARASASTISVAGVFRDVLLTFGGAALFNTPITEVQILGYLSACLGVRLWDEAKSRPDAFIRAFGLNKGESAPLLA